MLLLVAVNVNRGIKTYGAFGHRVANSEEGGVGLIRYSALTRIVFHNFSTFKHQCLLV